MIQKFINLEWKRFLRSDSFKINLILKIILGLGILFYAGMLLILGALSFMGIKKAGLDPLETINRYLIYWWGVDLILRYFIQKNPVMVLRPLLTQNLTKDKLTHYLLGKSVISFFNIYPFFFFLPFSITMLFNGYNVLGVICWHLAIMGISYLNNFLNLAVDNKTGWFIGLAVLMVGLGGFQYFGMLDISVYSGPAFQAFYKIPLLFIVIWGIVVLLYKYDYRIFRQSLYLDDRIKTKLKDADSHEFSWLNHFGLMGTFLKNDLRLILRNKRARTALWASFFCLFYGLFILKNGVFEGRTAMLVLVGIMISGGFLFSYGGFVPSWDSAYYPLMMSQNIKYRQYIASKWWLMVVATIISIVISAFYLYFGIQIYLAIVACGLYCIGVNAYLVLLGGAYTKTPLDLNSGRKPFGDKKAFNLKTLLLAIPQLLIPFFIYYLISFFFNPNTGFIAIGLTGCIGLLFRNAAFKLIERIYKEEKYDALLSYKHKG